MVRWVAAVLGVVSMSGAGAAVTEQPEPDAAAQEPVDDVARAVASALPFIDEDGRAWMAGELPVQDGKGCVSCHQVPFGVWSEHAAARVRLGAVAEGRRTLTSDALAFVSEADHARAVSVAILMVGLGEAVNEPRWRDTIVPWGATIAKLQTKAGNWEAKGQFPSQRRSERDSDAVATMWMILGLSQVHPLPDRMRRSKTKAVRWLKASEPGDSTEWWTSRLAVAHVLGEDPEAWARGVWSRQRPDGGFAFATGGRSDPYTTGQAIYALRCAGVPVDDPRLGRAVGWLLDHQGRDGTWTTVSAGVTTQPSARTDYVYRYWGTAWAVIGLASLRN
jgi:squalene-hopene/tetraprenyl-beta-curcumene cyclase